MRLWESMTSSGCTYLQSEFTLSWNKKTTILKQASTNVQSSQTSQKRIEEVELLLHKSVTVW